MTSTSSGNDVPTGTSRSLRIRQSRISYAEKDETEIEESDESKHQAKNNKRGAKRKAELNIESLYCPEKFKEVTPSLLETIFESPKKGQSRTKVVSSRNCDLSTEGQLMSLKKLKRFCAFSNYYHPTKQKKKVRKDRAKKLKLLTGVKVPKGNISDEKLLTALSVLSEDEESSEILTKSLCTGILSEDDDNEETMKTFYEGNVIKPDAEDTSMNEVINNISMMQVENKPYDEKDLSLIFSKDLEDSLHSSNENDNPNESFVQTKQNKSRRRSQKYFGSLLPLDIVPVPDLKLDALGNKERGKLVCSESPVDPIEQKDVNVVSNTPKRRTSLIDLKIVKKTKCFELSLKRENEYNDEKCLKKRGYLQDNSEKLHYEGTNVLDRSADGDAANLLVESVIALQESTAFEKSRTDSLAVPSSVQPKQKGTGPARGRKRGKRRVSGIRRPLYRTVAESNSPESELDISKCCSPECHDETQEALHQSTKETPLELESSYSCRSGASPRDLESVQYSKSQRVTSSVSPCSQMAALSLHSSDITQDRSLGSRRKSLRLSMVDKSSFFTFPETLSKSISDRVNGKVNEIDEVKQKKGKRLSRLFSQLELQTECNEDSVNTKVTVCCKKDPVSKTRRKSTANIGSSLRHQDVSQSVNSVKECSVEAYALSLSCSSNINHEVSTHNSTFNEAFLLTESEEKTARDSKVINSHENPDVSLARNTFDNHAISLCVLQDEAELNSPVLSGIFNKVSIRCGKIYTNPDVCGTNPISGIFTG